MNQLGFDFDGPTNIHRLNEVLERGPQPGVINRTAYIEAFIAVHGHFDSLRRMREETPWIPWKIGYTVPGNFATADELRSTQADGCTPTVLNADLRPPRDQTGPGTLLYRGACLGCDWEGPIRHDENSAVEDAHDHTYPTWWRTLPTITRLPGQPSPSRLAKFRAKITDIYEQHTPGATSHPAGCPVWTERRSSIITTPDGRTRTVAATRHHMDGLLGGWDLGRSTPPELPRSSIPRLTRTPPTPAETAVPQR